MRPCHSSTIQVAGVHKWLECSVLLVPSLKIDLHQVNPPVHLSPLVIWIPCSPSRKFHTCTPSARQKAFGPKPHPQPRSTPMTHVLTLKSIPVFPMPVYIPTRNGILITAHPTLIVCSQGWGADWVCVSGAVHGGWYVVLVGLPERARRCRLFHSRTCMLLSVSTHPLLFGYPVTAKDVVARVRAEQTCSPHVFGQT